MARKKTTKKKVTKRSTQRKPTSVTIQELQLWLSGVTEFTGADWVPSAEQWKVIHKKINSLVPDEPIVVETKDIDVPPHNPSSAESGDTHHQVRRVQNAPIINDTVVTDLINQTVAPTPPHQTQQTVRQNEYHQVAQSLPSNVIVPPDVAGVEVVTSGTILKGEYIDIAKEGCVSSFD